MGVSVRVNYNNKWIGDTVVSTYDKGGKQHWVMCFKDKYIKYYERKELEKIIVHSVFTKVGRQLDHVLSIIFDLVCQ